MVFGEINNLFEIYERMKNTRDLSKEQQCFDKTLIGFYHFGNHGRKGVKRGTINQLEDLSSMEIFTAIERAMNRDFLIDVSSHDGDEWLLSRKGVRYVEALIDK